MKIPQIAKTIIFESADALTLHRGFQANIGGEAIRFPARYARYFAPDFEPATFSFLRRYCRPGATALDIGAHLGVFSVVMSRLVGPNGRVYSFEPAPGTRTMLTRVLAMNHCTNVELRPEAVASGAGRAQLFGQGATMEVSTTLVAMEWSKGIVEVDKVSLDEFLRLDRNAPPGVWKIDAEGMELEVLRGARRTTLEHRPSIHVDVHPLHLREVGASLAEIWDFLAECRMAVSREGQAVDRQWFGEQEGLFFVQAIPQERADS
jgi:FkbM family methyltransferase